jgi:hypothetical protein
MLDGSFTRWFLLWFAAAVLLLLCVSLGIRVAAATGNACDEPASDVRLAGNPFQHIGVAAAAIGRDLATPY